MDLARTHFVTVGDRLRSLRIPAQTITQSPRLAPSLPAGFLGLEVNAGDSQSTVGGDLVSNEGRTEAGWGRSRMWVDCEVQIPRCLSLPPTATTSDLQHHGQLQTFCGSLFPHPHLHKAQTLSQTEHRFFSGSSLFHYDARTSISS